MFAKLEDTDRVIMSYEVPRVEEDGTVNLNTGSELLLIEIGDGLGDHAVLWRHRDLDEGLWNLQWKGNLSTCLKNFTEEVGDFDADFMIDRNAAESAAAK